MVVSTRRATAAETRESVNDPYQYREEHLVDAQVYAHPIKNLKRDSMAVLGTLFGMIENRVRRGIQ